MYLKGTKGVNVKCSHYKRIMWNDECLKKPYSGNHFAVYMCIKSSCLYVKVQNIMSQLYSVKL